MRRDTSVPAYTLAVCAIVKNEAPYIAEWIDWHRSQGVEKFYIYDNESSDNLSEVLEPYVREGLVDCTFFPGKGRQQAAYDDCISRHRLDARWIAFIDIDEFIVPVRDRSITEFLSSHEDAAAVEINWLCYGSGGQKEKAPGGVMERFRCHSLPGHKLNRHVKSIVNPRKVCGMAGAHECTNLTGRIVDSHGVPIATSYKHREPQQDVIRINHYAVKSLGEFVERKQGRGRVSDSKRTMPLDYFRRYDLNDICE